MKLRGSFARLNQQAIVSLSCVDEIAGADLKDQIRRENATPPDTQEQEFFI
jgi:hypothetical protein